MSTTKYRKRLLILNEFPRIPERELPTGNSSCTCSLAGAGAVLDPRTLHLRTLRYAICTWGGQEGVGAWVAVCI